MRFRNIVALSLLMSAIPSCSNQRRQNFTFDPHWEGLNNRGEKTPCRTTSQDFGYSPNTNHAGGAPGEMGGSIQTAADPAYYAMRLPKLLTFNDRISASGKFAFTDPEQSGIFVLGFFNSKTAIGWRTRNTFMMRLDHRGANVLQAHIEYCTGRWRAGASFIGSADPATDRMKEREIPLMGVHQWSFDYDPEDNNGGGSATLVVDDQRAVMNLDAGHKADGAMFDRFGMLNIMKSSDNRVTCYVDDLTVNGQTEDFSRDPGWEAVNNRRPSFEDCIVRFRFNFGFSPTHFAGGWPGELGGIVFRGDDRYPEKMAYYGDRTELLTMSAPLSASGRVAMTRGISDSTSLFGWFHSERSLKPSGQVTGLPRHFLGVMVEGPSGEGFLFRSAYRSENQYAYGSGPIILPDGAQHRWSLRFTPKPGGRQGAITVVFDGKSSTLELGDNYELPDARFDHFGFITTAIDGNYQFIYYDDLKYTFRQR